MTKIVAIAAMDEGRVIGIDNSIPWNLPEDMKHFSSLTSGHSVLMGRKTYFSLPKKFRPLPNRNNIVVTRYASSLESEPVEVVLNLEEYLEGKKNDDKDESLWVIGGSEIYKQTMQFWDEMHLTKVYGNHAGDAYFPEFEENFELKSENPQENCSFLHYIRKIDVSHQEIITS